jgi:hypothetical protein
MASRAGRRGSTTDPVGRSLRRRLTVRRRRDLSAARCRRGRVTGLRRAGPKVRRMDPLRAPCEGTRGSESGTQDILLPRDQRQLLTSDSTACAHRAHTSARFTGYDAAHRHPPGFPGTPPHGTRSLGKGTLSAGTPFSRCVRETTGKAWPRPRGQRAPDRPGSGETRSAPARRASSGQATRVTCPQVPAPMRGSSTRETCGTRSTPPARLLGTLGDRGFGPRSSIRAAPAGIRKAARRWW